MFNFSFKKYTNSILKYTFFFVKAASQVPLNGFLQNTEFQVPFSTSSSTSLLQLTPKTEASLCLCVCLSSHLALDLKVLTHKPAFH